MQLDWVEKTGYFVLRVPRAHDKLKELITEHGLDFSTSASTPDTAVLFTSSVYAAMTYADHATPQARAKFGDLIRMVEASKALRSNNVYRLRDYPLFSYQNAALDYGSQRTNFLIGDDPGTGKTEMSIAYANHVRAKRVLVVCPASVRLQWADRVRNCTLMERPIIYPILKSSDGVHPKAEWTIISYDLLRSPAVFAALKAGRYDIMIVDEAHYLKSPSAIRTKQTLGAEGIAGSCGAIVGLTGTPLPNRPRECYTLSRSLCWDAIDFMSEKSFQDRYNPSELRKGKNGGKYVIEKTGRLFELQNRLRANYMVRRRKRDVLDQLPDIRYEIVHVDETDGIRKAIEAEKMLDIDPENLKGVDAKILGHISTARLMMGVAKAPQAADYVKYVLESGEDKVVVFAWHIEAMNIIEERLAKYGVARVDGSTSALRKERLVSQFVTQADTRVFLGNLQSIGVGVDGLQKVCSRGIFAECSWTPADNDQGVGRLERQGQKHGMLIEFLVAPGSLDERVLGSSLRKLKDIHTSLDATV